MQPITTFLISMKYLFSLIFLLATSAAFALPPISQSNPFDDSLSDLMGESDGADESEKTTLSIISEVLTAAPGETISVAIPIQHIDGWHAYYKNPGGPGLPLEFDAQLPEGYTLKNLHWPTPHLYTNEYQFYVYEGNYTFIADVTVPASAKVGDTAKLSFTPSWQICDINGCLPPESKELSLSLTITAESKQDPAKQELFAQARAALPVPASKDWQVDAEITDNQVILTIKPKTAGNKPLGQMHYVSDEAAVDSQKKQTLTESEGVYTLKAARNVDSSLGRQISGILIDTEHKHPPLAFTTAIDAQPGQTDSAAAKPASSASTTAAKASGHGIHAEAPSAEDITAAAKLYDVSKKIDYVLLDGSKEKPLTFVTALGFIFIGGFLLNLMPCVFPVLGIKVMGFAQQAGSEPRKIKFHGLVFMAGLVASMWVLAGIIYILIFAFGRDVNWGEQLTSPEFLAAMIMLLFLFGLNMAGVFEIGTSLTGAGGELQTKKGYSGSFFSGVLTTLIATPCSGPFLGSVMGYTLKQPPFQGMVIFTVFALGISLPYVVLAFFPKLINKLPRPGAWMVTFKQLMAFALFATAAYFYQSFAKITGTGGASWLLMALVIAGLAVWAYGRFGTPFTPKNKKVIWGYTFPIVVAAGAFMMSKSATQERAPVPPPSGSSWYPGVVEQNRAKKRIVWVDYTADW